MLFFKSCKRETAKDDLRWMFFPLGMPRLSVDWCLIQLGWPNTQRLIYISLSTKNTKTEKNTMQQNLSQFCQIERFVLKHDPQGSSWLQ